MSLSGATESQAMTRQARLAGMGYLFIVAGGLFAHLVVREQLFIAGDPAGTAREIIENELLWRAGIAVHLLYLPIGGAVGVILYRIFRTVQPSLALIALVLMLADVIMEAVLLSRLYVPLAMIEESNAIAALGAPERHALAYLAIRLFFTGWSFALLVFSGFCAITGVLILRSQLVPRVIGVLMIAAGAAYFLNSIFGLLAPAVSPRLAPLLLFSFIGELSFTLWLLIKGVRTDPEVT